MPVKAGILNRFGIAHAGAILWLADVCTTLLAHRKTEFTAGGGCFPLGISLNASFIGNKSDGVFKAVSLFAKHGRQLSVARTTVSGESGRPIVDVTNSHIPANSLLSRAQIADPENIYG
jgi:1,4-dihydroxy-2-naphthoyl-CoA hydrolase